MLALVLAVTLTQAPLGVGQVPTSNMGSFPASSYPQHLFGDSTKGCVQWSFGGTGWRCLVGEGQPVNGLRSLSSAPSTPTAGETYYDTAKGCLQTWTGTTWSPTACPITVAPTPAVTVGSSAPSLPSGDASLNRGRFWLDTTTGCTRQTPDGLAWGDCLTVEKCVSVSVSGVSIPLLGVSSTSTASLAGAVVGRPCTAGLPGFLPLNASAVCRVSAAGTLEYRFQSNSGLLSLAIAVPNGTYTLCTTVNW